MNVIMCVDLLQYINIIIIVASIYVQSHYYFFIPMPINTYYLKAYVEWPPYSHISEFLVILE